MTTFEEKVIRLETYCAAQPSCACCKLDKLSERFGTCDFCDVVFVEKAYPLTFCQKKLIDISKAHAQIMDSVVAAFETFLEQIEEECGVEQTTYEGNEVVSNVAVYGLKESIKRSKYPKSVDISKCTDEITKGVKALANCQTGTGHDQFLTGIIVQFDLTFTIKAWTEAERYHWLDFVSSQSTMHKIAQFDIAKQCHEYVDPGIINIVKVYVDWYNENPTPENYLRLLYNVPVGFKLTAGMTTNYRQLKTIYAQRKTHRLPEWREFCSWVETLPMAEFIIGGDNNVKSEGNFETG